MFTGAEEVDQALELRRVFRADVGSLAQQVLRVLDATHQGIDARVAEAGVDDDGAGDSLTGRFQQILATVGHVGNLLDGGHVVGVLAEIAELAQTEVGRQSRVIELCVFH